MVRTRFAPSPTGFMHIGGIRTALYAYLVAKKDMGEFILRIEDTDEERFVEGATEVIYSTLKGLGLDWDEGPDVGGPYGPYTQSERQGMYVEYAMKLVEEGKAYYCFCDDTRLDELRAKAKAEKKPFKYDGICKKLTIEQIQNKIDTHLPYTTRFKITPNQQIVFDDRVYGRIEVNSNELEDFILIKSDDMPTYNFANIIDDYEMKITHIIRGNEYISSTPKYLMVYEALGFDVPEFIHLPIIKKDKDSDKKLSKRSGDATYENLKAKGYLDKAIINMLALTGWSPPTEQEIYTLDELTQVFDPSRIGKSNAIFDMDKLNWLNNHYLRELSDEEYVEFLLPFLIRAYDMLNISHDWTSKLCLLFKDQIKHGTEIEYLAKMFFVDKVTYEEDALEFIKENDITKTIAVFKNELENIDEWNIDNINQAINNTKEEAQVKGKLLFMPIRITLTGKMHGPELPMIIYLLGKEKCIDLCREV